MIISEQTDALFKAFSKFQGELENASKDKQGHGYKYADLAECINTAKPHLATNGLAVSQMLGMNQDGKQTLITVLTHESGQYMGSEFVMVDAKLMGGAGSNPAQVLGSAITYQRRYAYASIIGLAQEDDDASNVGKQKQKSKQVDHDKLKVLGDLIASKGFTEQQVCETWNIKSLDQCDVDSAINIVKSWG